MAIGTSLVVVAVIVVSYSEVLVTVLNFVLIALDVEYMCWLFDILDN